LYICGIVGELAQHTS